MKDEKVNRYDRLRPIFAHSTELPPLRVSNKNEDKLTSEKNAMMWMNTNKYLISVFYKATAQKSSISHCNVHFRKQLNQIPTKKTDILIK